MGTSDHRRPAGVPENRPDGLGERVCKTLNPWPTSLFKDYEMMCGTCKHWCDYASRYDDPEEDHDLGVCQNEQSEYNVESSSKYWEQTGIEDTCEQHEELK
jgi:hypothetical protein